jgi:hypothetical protein
LNDEQSVKKYSKSLKEIKKTFKINTRKVAGHDHLTGKFQGAAHNICNLNYQNPRFMQITMLTFLLNNLVKIVQT